VHVRAVVLCDACD